MGCGASSKAALNVIEPPQHRNIKHDAEPVTDSEVLHPSGPEVAADLEQNNHNRHPLLEEFTRNINVRVPEPFIALVGCLFTAVTTEQICWKAVSSSWERTVSNN